MTCRTRHTWNAYEESNSEVEVAHKVGHYLDDFPRDSKPGDSLQVWTECKFFLVLKEHWAQNGGDEDLDEECRGNFQWRLARPEGFFEQQDPWIVQG